MTSSTHRRFPGYQRVIWTGNGWTPSDAQVSSPNLVAWKATFKAPPTDHEQGDMAPKRLAPRPADKPDHRPRHGGNR